jgi:hypothetical protein
MEKFKCCPLTGWKIRDDYDTPKLIGDRYLHITTFHEDLCVEYIIEKSLTPFLEKSRPALRWAILNGSFNHNIYNRKDIDGNETTLIINNSVIKGYINSFEAVSPKEKLDQLLLALFKLRGNSYSFEKSEEEIFQYTAFDNKPEMIIYLIMLKKEEQIEYKIYPNRTIDIIIHYNGLLKISKLKESGKNSKRCFVAMSFDPSLKETREAIRTGINEAGYVAIFIDEVYPEPDQTINDAIIAEIKRSKFLVADFTQQKNGVYFEAGYALGRGLKVIYCCDEEDFKNSHFDLKSFSHILYKSNEELQNRLKYKIEAWIE